MSDLKLGTFNTESGSRPGFHDYLNHYITHEKPDLVALQEVHSALSDDVPETCMPSNPGKRVFPMRLRLYQELCARYHDRYELLFEPHVFGFHDCEPCAHNIAFGQVTMVRREKWQITQVKTGLVFGQGYQFNTEHTVGHEGAPCSKAAITVHITCRAEGRSVVVSNVHGFWVSRGKIDIPQRFTQNLGIAAQITDTLRQSATSLVLCVGDLNYRSDMQALENLRTQLCFGYAGRVLNHDFEITRTRTDHYTNWENEPEADFMIASADLADCAVYLKSHLDVPSDHALLEAKFKIT